MGEYIRKINDINEIYDGNDLLISDFSNMDLSNIDLSCIPMETWENCIFYNTNLKNTGIRFIPSKLKSVNKVNIDYCDFSDNDLSYLERKDFCFENSKEEISTYGCNFRNTKMNCLTKLLNVELDSSYQNFDKEYFGTRFEFFVNNYYVDIDINTILKNPFLNVSSARLLWIIYRYCQKKSQNGRFEELFSYQYRNLKDTDEKVLEFKKQLIEECEMFLELDKEGYAKKFYKTVSKDMILEQKFSFFFLEILNMKLENIDFSEIPFGILSLYEWSNNELNNVTIGGTMWELMHHMSQVNIVDYDKENKYKNLEFPNISYSSWQENDRASKRVSSSYITFFNKVYLELSRACNANCPFCRNNSFTECKYDLNKIKDTLYMIRNYINAVVIGGGEPTLRLDDVKKLKNYIISDKIDWHLFTNGTSPMILEDDYVMDNFKINLSRHAIDDECNAEIFGVDKHKIMTSNDIEKLNLRNGEVTLNATCFKGGLDSLSKIIGYINFARSIGCKKVLIQDLQKDTSLGFKDLGYSNLCIDPLIFEQLIEYLRSQYKTKYPIYATGGYVTNIFYTKDFSISIQRYITVEQLSENWKTAIKRTFDLSIDPSGNLYENWSQTSGFVKKI